MKFLVFVVAGLQTGGFVAAAFCLPRVSRGGGLLGNAAA